MTKDWKTHIFVINRIYQYFDLQTKANKVQDPID